MQTRMAAIGLEEDAKNQILENQIKMMELGVPQEKSSGFGLQDALGLGSQIFGAASSLGAFSGGGAGGGMSFADGMDLGLPSFGDYGGMQIGGFPGAFG